MIMPLWGLSTQTLNGYANFHYNIAPKKLFQSIDIGLNNASFAYRPFSEPFTFYRTKGFFHFTIKPKNLRSSIRNYIELEYTNVAARWLEKESKTPDSLRTKPYFAQNKAPIDYSFARVNFLHENKKTINPYTIKLSVERGGIYNEVIAEKFIFQKTLIAKELMKHGIKTILTRPEELTINSVNKYLEIKSLGLI